MYKAEINMISTKLNSNNVRKTLPEKIKTSTLNIGKISFFLCTHEHTSPFERTTYGTSHVQYGKYVNDV